MVGVWAASLSDLTDLSVIHMIGLFVVFVFGWIIQRIHMLSVGRAEQRAFDALKFASETGKKSGTKLPAVNSTNSESEIIVENKPRHTTTEPYNDHDEIELSVSTNSQSSEDTSTNTSTYCKICTSQVPPGWWDQHIKSIKHVENAARQGINV